MDPDRQVDLVGIELQRAMGDREVGLGDAEGPHKTTAQSDNITCCAT